MQAYPSTPSRLINPLRASLGALLVTILTGCHVSVTDSPGGHETDIAHSVARFDTEFLVRHALVPYALAATSIDMVADPDAFLTPRSRTRARDHAPIESTSTYLFDSGPCDYGGTTSLEATGETETYADAMTFVTLDVSASADRCETLNWQGYVTLNSHLEFDVTGWYDDHYREIASLEGRMSGRLRITGARMDVNYTNIDSHIVELSPTDFRIQTNASLWLDDGWLTKNATLSTPRGVHWYQGDRFPHAGRVRLQGHRGWVELTFSDSGVSRDDSRGNRQYWSWSSLD